MVLIVEDDDDIRTTIAFALNAEGYPTIQAKNGREALEVLESANHESLPQCILLDLMMPEMDGNTFLQVLENSPSAAWKKIPIIIQTAKGSGDLKDKNIRKSHEWLMKPIELEDLYKVVAKYASPNPAGPSES